MDLQLNDRVVIVTGAAAGIGQATASVLTAEGAVVVGVDRDVVESGLGNEGSAIRADLTDAASPPRIIESVLKRYGRIDGLVNNAGGLQLHSGFLGITEAQWLDTFQLNFHAARRMSRGGIARSSTVTAGAWFMWPANRPDSSVYNPTTPRQSLVHVQIVATEFTPRGVRSNIVTGMTRTIGASGQAVSATDRRSSYTNRKRSIKS
jgi:NAD(P)-dependent dehydrogenase (short-subunit alcohol dehydrogenase family)